MNDQAAEVRRRVRVYCADRGISQARLARSLGWHKSTLSSYLAGGSRETGRGTSEPLARALSAIPELGLTLCSCGHVECPGCMIDSGMPAASASPSGSPHDDR